MAVKRLNLGAVGERVGNDHNIPPTRSRVGGIRDNAIGDRIDRLAAIRIAAGVFVPVFAEVVVGSKV